MLIAFVYLYQQEVFIREIYINLSATEQLWIFQPFFAIKIPLIPFPYLASKLYIKSTCSGTMLLSDF
jgi:NADH:ubiquinone oxidoreductase subunit 4 (subunit M)